MQLFPPFAMKKRNLVFRTLAVLIAITCLVSVLAQTVFAQNTYVITDGSHRIVHTTFTTDPARVLTEAGFDLEADDTYTTVTTDGVSKITVRRSKTVTVDNCGKILTVTGNGQTVAEILTRMGIPTNSEYTVTPALDTVATDGMQITVTRTVTVVETYVVEQAFETVTCEDPTLAKGQEKILVPGSVGMIQRKAEVVYTNAVEQSRTVIEETELEPVVNQVVAIGTGEEVGKTSTKPLIGDGVIVLPSGEILTYSKTEQFVATAYSKYNAGCDDYTATGTRVRWGVVAVDPTVIPYGTRMFIVSNDGKYVYGVSTAEDCGGSIKGNRLDLYMDTDAECFQFGVRDCTVYFLGDANWNDR